MISLTVILTFLGFFVLYNTSRRAKLSSGLRLEKWVQQHPGTSKKIGLVLLVFGLITGILAWGLASGIFAFLVILMTVASLIVIVAPLRFFNYQSIVIAGVVSILLEFFIQ